LDVGTQNGLRELRPGGSVAHGAHGWLRGLGPDLAFMGWGGLLEQVPDCLPMGYGS
jgi:hypothetical protein